MAKRRKIIHIRMTTMGTMHAYRPMGGGGKAPLVVKWGQMCRFECGHWRTYPGDSRKEGDTGLCEKCK